MRYITTFLRRSILIVILAFELFSCSAAPPKLAHNPTNNQILPVTSPSTTTQQTAFPMETQSPSTPTEIALLGKGSVDGVVWSPDRKTFVVGGTLGIYQYDAQTHALLQHIPLESPVNMEFSPNGKLLAATGDSRHLFDLSTGREILGNSPDAPLDGDTIFSPDSSTLVVTLRSAEGADIYDLKTLQRTAQIRGAVGQEHKFLQSVISPDGHWLALVDQAAQQIILWDLVSNARYLTLSHHTGLVSTVNFSPDSCWLVSAGDDLTIRFWNVATGQLIRTLTGLSGQVYRISFSADEKQVTVNYAFQNSEVLDSLTGQKIREIPNISPPNYSDPSYDFLGLQGFQSGSPAFSMAFGPDGNSLAMVGNDTVIFWNLTSQTVSRVIHLDNIPLYIRNYDFSASGGSTGLDKNEILARQLSQSIEPILKPINGDLRAAVVISPDSKKLAVAGKESLELWNIANQTRLWHITPLGNWITELYFSPSGGTLTAIARNRMDYPSEIWALLIDTNTGKTIHQLNLFSNDQNTIYTAVSGRWLAAGYEYSDTDRPIWVYDLVSGESFPQLQGLGKNDLNALRDLQLSPDGRLTALLLNDHFYIWSTATGKLLFDFTASQGQRFYKLAFSPDAGTMAISFENSQMAVWDIRALRDAAVPLTETLLQSLPSAPTPTPTATTTPTTDLIRYQCLGIAPTTTGWTPLSGNLVLGGLSGFGDSRLLSLKDGTVQDLSADFDQARIVSASTSPDGKWLALMIFEERTRSYRLKVSPFDSLHGRIYNYPLLDRDVINMIGWLDNSQIVFLKRGYFAETIAMNVFSGGQASFYLEKLPDYPVLMGARGVYFANSNLMPDPSLNLVVFPQFDPGDKGGYFIVLWDRRMNAVLAKIRDYSSWNHDPLWSVNAADFLIAVETQPENETNTNEWFQVSKSSQVRQITHYGDYLKSPQISNTARSPQGDQVAFSLNGQLAVLNVATQQTVIYCIPGGNWPGPIWSPDERYLAISVNYADNANKVILVDTVENKAAYIANDAAPTGWLINP
ncbi:MAG: WD40 repeat domain-containing protein [Anaerolineaceae bacterium]|nr:WD40 repeat domain-containing protein [Anaerolineaceae bacterium]